MDARGDDELVFPIARMSMAIRVITIAVLALPLLFAGISLSFWPMAIVLPLLAVLYAWVWLWMRPTRFVIAPGGVRVEWQMRTRTWPLAPAESVVLYSAKEFQREYRFGLRWGVGGLWGGFGLLLTKKGWLSMYISRTGDLVVVNFRDRRPLLITPERPQEFVEALQRAMEAAAGWQGAQELRIPGA